MQFPATPSDGAHATTSYKEESLLRKDHFELGQPESRRRGTVPSGNQSEPASIGRSFVHERLARRNVSVMHLNRIKHDIAVASGSGSGSASQPASGAPAAGTRGVRRSGAHSDSGQSGTDSSAASSSHSQSTISPASRSKASASPTSGSAKKIPPPLLRTWHTPPSTGPPTEPLPSPPGSASLQPLILAGSARTAGSLPAPSPPPSPRKALPPLPPKDETRRPSSPASVTVTSAARGAPVPAPASAGRAGTGAGTGMREDAVKRVLADAHASAAELRAALEAQSAKYARLMSYLLSLTERHGMEKHEFVRRIEALEADARRRERELKGLRWLVANQSQSQSQSGGAGQGVGVGAKRREGAPARADSAVLPRSEARNRQRSASESVVSP
ncbi:hypothetical protein BD413DRAFT_444508, partial [Trametes elegans]